MLVEVMLFALASLAHGGWLVRGFAHPRASIAEAVIAMVLVVGFIVALAKPPLARRALLVAQSIAVAGVLAGLGLIAIGVGPQTMTVLILQAVMLLSLVVGFLLTLRAR